MEVRIINRKEDINRKKDLIEHLSRYKNLEIKWIEAVEPDQIFESYNQFDGSKIPLKAAACAMSHAKSLEEPFESPILICEDDVRFTDDPFTVCSEIFKSLEGKDVLIASIGCFYYIPSGFQKINNLDTILTYKSISCPLGAHAYLVFPSGRDSLIKRFSSYSEFADMILPSLMEEGKAYLLRPTIAWQYPYKSNIQSNDTNWYVESADIRDGSSIEDSQFTLPIKIHEKPKYMVSWFDNTKYNFESVINLFKDKKVNGLEIGSFEGMSANWMVENWCNHPGSRLTCIDPFEGSIEHSEKEKYKLYDRFIRNVSSNIDKISIMKNYSYIALPKLIESGEMFDFIYIDGDHHNFSVLLDAIFADKLLNKNGLLIFDDYPWGKEKSTYEKPKDAIDYFFNIMEDRYEIIIKNWQIFSIKK